METNEAVFFFYFVVVAITPTCMHAHTHVHAQVHTQLVTDLCFRWILFYFTEYIIITTMQAYRSS